MSSRTRRIRFWIAATVALVGLSVGTMTRPAHADWTCSTGWAPNNATCGCWASDPDSTSRIGAARVRTSTETQAMALIPTSCV